MNNINLEEEFDIKRDLSANEKTVFVFAKSEYEKLVKYLSDHIFQGRVEFENRFKNTEFSLKNGLEDLDIILQYSIVEIGYKNGFINDESVSTIEGVCKYGSLLKEIRCKHSYFNWTDFTSLECSEVGDVLKSLSIYISKVSKDFAKFFVFVNPTEQEQNFAKVVQQKMNNIINIWYA